MKESRKMAAEALTRKKSQPWAKQSSLGRIRSWDMWILGLCPWVMTQISQGKDICKHLGEAVKIGRLVCSS